MNDIRPPILILPKQSGWAEENGLPVESDNLFQRLIRNPQIESRNPRERECTEMLCSVLRNAHALRLRLFRWLSEVTGCPDLDHDVLDFEIDTEQPIASKRDDLRVEGWRSEGDDEHLVVLWTIEVKVGAGFHESSRIGPTEYGEDLRNAVVRRESDTTEASAEEEGEESLVHQLIIYDSWLSERPAKHKAGFVLAIEDMTAHLPASLKCRWKCVTWTDLGLKVKAAIDSDCLPVEERLLARHLLGFVKAHLWSSAYMSHEPLDFDDVAFLRAFARMAFTTEKKVNRLVATLVPVLEKSGVGYCQVRHQTGSLFKGLVRSVVYRQLFDNKVSCNPILFMGVNEDWLTLWLDTPAGHSNKSRILDGIQSAQTALRLKWRVTSHDDNVPRDMELREPLSSLLSAPDQEAYVAEFFTAALVDLRQAGVVEAIERALQGTAK